MAHINTIASQHGNKRELYSGGVAVDYNVFLETTASDRSRLAKVKRAVEIVDQLNGRANLYGACNQYFRSLPRGLSLRGAWESQGVFIDFSPTMMRYFFGATHSNNRDIAISAWCLDTQNVWVVAATIVHEMAHVAGAPGGSSRSAEDSLNRCGLGTQFDPSAVGVLEQFSNYLGRMV